jgi:hypothetical protein
LGITRLFVDGLLCGLIESKKHAILISISSNFSMKSGVKNQHLIAHAHFLEVVERLEEFARDEFFFL